MPRPQRSQGERIFVAVIGFVFVVQFILALSYPSDPRLFPLLVTGVGILIAVAMEFGFGLGKPASEEPGALPPRLLAMALLAPPLYALCLWALGFWIATLAAIPIIAWLLDYRKRLILLLVTVGMALAIGVTFPLVNVVLPTGALFEPHALF